MKSNSFETTRLLQDEINSRLNVLEQLKEWSFSDYTKLKRAINRLDSEIDKQFNQRNKEGKKLTADLCYQQKQG